MRTILAESESRGVATLDLVSVPVPAIPGLEVLFLDPNPTAWAIRDTIPAEPGIVLVLNWQDRSDDTKLLVLAEDLLMIELVDNVQDALMEATRQMPSLTRDCDRGFFQIAYVLSADVPELSTTALLFAAVQQRRMRA